MYSLRARSCSSWNLLEFFAFAAAAAEGEGVTFVRALMTAGLSGFPSESFFHGRRQTQQRWKRYLCNYSHLPPCPFLSVNFTSSALPCRKSGGGCVDRWSGFRKGETPSAETELYEHQKIRGSGLSHENKYTDCTRRTSTQRVNSLNN